MLWAKRIFIALTVLLIVAFVGFNLFKKQIATRIFHTAVERNAGVDRSADLADGLHVYLCGTGSPMPDASRAGPCFGIIAGERVFVIDVGSGGSRNLGAMGFPLGRIDRVYLTHLHSDHIDGLGELLLLSWINGSRSQPTPVLGPRGTKEVVEGLNAVYRIDSTYRIAHHGPDIANPAGYGGVAEEIDVAIGPGGQLVVLEEGDLKITAIRVDHAPVEPAYAYRIDYKDRSISISGDTVYSPTFVVASTEVDIMFHEALNKDMVTFISRRLSEKGQANTAKILIDITDYHATPEDAARSAQKAEATELVLYHIVPPLPVKVLETVFIGNADAVFTGKISVGRDGMVFSLPAGSNKIERFDALR